MCNTKITVVDAIMGAGKTTWSIDFINQQREKNIMYITPFLDEVQRILHSVDRGFYEPINRGKGKQSDLRELVRNEKDIASTHALFGLFNEKTRQVIADRHYILILDEAVNAVLGYNSYVSAEDKIDQCDLNYLFKNKSIWVDDDNYVHWNTEYKDGSKFSKVKELAEAHSLLYLNETFMIWRLPPEIFEAFDEVYVLTYLFESTLMKYYFDFCGFTYKKKSIKKVNDVYMLVDYYKADTTKYQSLIHIYSGKMNRNYTGKDSNGKNAAVKFTNLSKTWYEDNSSSKRRKYTIDQLKSNGENFINHKRHGNNSNSLWTAFKTSEEGNGFLRGKGYYNSFIACNCRATNNYGDRYNLIYFLNRYVNTNIRRFFETYNIRIDEDKYALSELLQWIWRSAIRNGNEIWIYIPSKRMRYLLCEWLQIPLID